MAGSPTINTHLLSYRPSVENVLRIIKHPGPWYCSTDLYTVYNAQTEISIKKKISFKITKGSVLTLKIGNVEITSDDKHALKSSGRNIICPLRYKTKRREGLLNGYLLNLSAQPIPYQYVAESLHISAEMGVLSLALCIDHLYYGCIMAKKEGEQVNAWFKSRSTSPSTSSLTLTTRLSIAQWTIAALIQLHQNGYIHRDFNDTNAVVDLSAGTVALIDFEFACRMESGASKVALDVARTNGFTAPEIEDESRYSQASDVYALGCYFLAILSQESEALGSEKRAPEWQASFMKVGFLKTQADALVFLISRMRASAPKERPTCREVLGQFSAIFEGEPPLAAALPCPRRAKPFFTEIAQLPGSDFGFDFIYTGGASL